MCRGGPRLAKSPDRHEGREVKLSYVHAVGTTPLIADTIGGAPDGAAQHCDREALVASRYIRFTREFPMTVTGKVQKFKMRELTDAELTLARVTDVEPTSGRREETRC